MFDVPVPYRGQRDRGLARCLAGRVRPMSPNGAPPKTTPLYVSWYKSVFP